MFNFFYILIVHEGIFRSKNLILELWEDGKAHRRRKHKFDDIRYIFEILTLLFLKKLNIFLMNEINAPKAFNDKKLFLWIMLSLWIALDLAEFIDSVL